MNCPNCGKPLRWTEPGSFECDNADCSGPSYQKLTRENGTICYIRRPGKLLQRPPVTISNSTIVETWRILQLRSINAEYICVRCLHRKIASMKATPIWQVSYFCQGVIEGDFETDPENAAQVLGQFIGGLTPHGMARDMIANGYNIHASKISMERGMLGIGLNAVALIPMGKAVKAFDKAAQTAKDVELVTETTLSLEKTIRRGEELTTYGQKVRQMAELSGKLPKATEQRAKVLERLDGIRKKYEAALKQFQEVAENIRKEIQETEALKPGQSPLRQKLTDKKIADLQNQLVAREAMEAKTLGTSEIRSWEDLFRTMKDVQGPGCELAHVEQLIKDPNVLEITHIDEKLYDRIEKVVESEGKATKVVEHVPRADIDVGFIKKENDELVHYIDSLKSRRFSFQEGEFNECRGVLNDLRDYALRATNSPLKCRLIIEGEAQGLEAVLTDGGTRLKKLQDQVTKINRELEAAKKLPYQKAVIELVVARSAAQAATAQPMTGQTPSGQVATGQGPIVQAASHPALTLPKCSCGENMVYLTPLFAVCSPAHEHDWKDWQSITDEIGSTPAYHCENCGEFKTRGIVSTRLDYYQDKDGCLKVLERAWHLANVGTAPHDWVQTDIFGGKDYLQCKICGHEKAIPQEGHKEPDKRQQYPLPPGISQG